MGLAAQIKPVQLTSSIGYERAANGQCSPDPLTTPACLSAILTRLMAVFLFDSLGPGCARGKTIRTFSSLGGISKVPSRLRIPVVQPGSILPCCPRPCLTWYENRQTQLRRWSHSGHLISGRPQVVKPARVTASLRPRRAGGPVWFAADDLLARQARSGYRDRRPASTQKPFLERPIYNLTILRSAWGSPRVQQVTTRPPRRRGSSRCPPHLAFSKILRLIKGW
jgi:hypothetical protein